MAVRSDRLWSMNAVDLVGSWVTLAQVPAGERWLLKEIAVRHASAGDVTLFMRSSATDHFAALVVPPGPMVIEDRWCILPEGSLVQMFAPAADDVRGVASGTRFVI